MSPVLSIVCATKNRRYVDVLLHVVFSSCLTTVEVTTVLVKRLKNELFVLCWIGIYFFDKLYMGVYAFKERCKERTIFSYFWYAWGTVKFKFYWLFVIVPNTSVCIYCEEFNIWKISFSTDQYSLFILFSVYKISYIK